MKRTNRTLFPLALVFLLSAVLTATGPLPVPLVLAQAPQPSAPDAPPPAPAIQTQMQLQQLVAPIALYPDQLVAQILSASAFPVEITEAKQWVADHPGLAPAELGAQVDRQQWDPSVKALVQYPPVLQSLAANLSWTSDLGDAYANQPNDVMDAVQALRTDAKKNGTLKSNSQMKVKDEKGYITIDNAEQQTLYVPEYDPWMVYGYPFEPWPGWVDVPGIWWDGPGLYFGLGFGLGPFWDFGWGWRWWGFNWHDRGLFFHGAPYYARGPVFFDRGRFYSGRPGFVRPAPVPRDFARGYTAPRPGPVGRSGPFSGIARGGNARGFSARGQGSMGGSFHGGGFGGGGFRGGGRR
jgi:hypothetical protein